MTTCSARLPAGPRQYSSRPCRANRRTKRRISLSVLRRPDANERSGRPVRRSRARFAARALNCPKASERRSTQATIVPFGCVSSVTCSPSRADSVAGATRRLRFGPEVRKPGCPSGLGVKRVELVFRKRVVSPSKLDRDVIKSTGREAAIEMPQTRNGHPDDRDLNIGARLVEHEEIEARALGHVDAGSHLLARVETAEFGAGVRSDGRRVARR